MDTPLCCRYLVMQIRSFEVCLSGTEGRDVCVHHGLGTLDNGESEFIGTWVESADCACDWDSVMRTLRERGLERVRYVVGPSSLTRAACAAFGAQEPPAEIARQTGRVIRSADARSMKAGLRLQRVAARRRRDESMDTLKALFRSAETYAYRWL